MFAISRSRRKARRFVPLVECLESRLAPATFVNATTVTYQDVDGDNVTIRSTSPIFSAANVNSNTVLVFDSVAVGNATPQQLQLIDLTSPNVAVNPAGDSLTITAKRDPVTGGDGFVNIGYINAAGINLNQVTIHGDLGRIDAGAGSTTIAGLASLNIQSMGRYGTQTQASLPTPDLVSNIAGKLGAFVVQSDIVAAEINVTGGTSGQIGSISMGGSILAQSGQNQSGFITTTGSIGSVSIGGGIVGPTGQTPAPF